MSRRDEFRDALAERLMHAHPPVVADAEQARAVASMITGWSTVERVYEEVDLTTLGHTEELLRYDMTLVGTLKILADGGEYRRPHRSAWLALP